MEYFWAAFISVAALSLELMGYYDVLAYLYYQNIHRKDNYKE